jgi:hypothetical protein
MHEAEPASQRAGQRRLAARWRAHGDHHSWSFQATRIGVTQVEVRLRFTGEPIQVRGSQPRLGETEAQHLAARECAITPVEVE